MTRYVARQAIYNLQSNVYGYELLYRNSNQNFFPNIDDSLATKELTANVLTDFGNLSRQI